MASGAKDFLRFFRREKAGVASESQQGWDQLFSLFRKRTPEEIAAKEAERAARALERKLAAETRAAEAEARAAQLKADAEVRTAQHQADGARKIRDAHRIEEEAKAAAAESTRRMADSEEQIFQETLRGTQAAADAAKVREYAAANGIHTGATQAGHGAAPGGGAPGVTWRLESKQETKMRTGTENGAPIMVPELPFSPTSLEDNLLLGNIYRDRWKPNLWRQTLELWNKHVGRHWGSGLPSGKDADGRQMQAVFQALEEFVLRAELAASKGREDLVKLHQSLTASEAWAAKKDAVKLFFAKAGVRAQAYIKLQKPSPEALEAKTEATRLAAANRQEIITGKIEAQNAAITAEEAKAARVRPHVHKAQSDLNSHLFAYSERPWTKRGFMLFLYFAWKGATSLVGGPIQTVIGRAPTTLFMNRPQDRFPLLYGRKNGLYRALVDPLASGGSAAIRSMHPAIWVMGKGLQAMGIILALPTVWLTASLLHTGVSKVSGGAVSPPFYAPWDEETQKTIKNLWPGQKTGQQAQDSEAEKQRRDRDAADLAIKRAEEAARYRNLLGRDAPSNPPVIQNPPPPAESGQEPPAGSYLSPSYWWNKMFGPSTPSTPSAQITPPATQPAAQPTPATKSAPGGAQQSTPPVNATSQAPAAAGQAPGSPDITLEQLRDQARRAVEARKKAYPTELGRDLERLRQSPNASTIDSIVAHYVTQKKLVDDYTLETMSKDIKDREAATKVLAEQQATNGRRLRAALQQATSQEDAKKIFEERAKNMDVDAEGLRTSLITYMTKFRTQLNLRPGDPLTPLQKDARGLGRFDALNHIAASHGTFVTVDMPKGGMASVPVSVPASMDQAKVITPSLSSKGDKLVGASPAKLADNPAVPTEVAAPTRPKGTSSTATTAAKSAEPAPPAPAA